MPSSPLPPPFPSLSPSHNALNYGRLKPSTSEPNPDSRIRTRNLLHRLTALAVVLLLLAAAVGTVAVVKSRGGSSAGDGAVRPTKAITRVCGRTRYPSLCVNSLVGYPGALSADERQLVHISVNITRQKFGEALDLATEMIDFNMGPLGRSAFDDCLELLDDSVDLLTRSLFSVWSASVAEQSAGGGGNNQGGTTEDVMTWLSAAMTNYDTCTEGFEAVSGPVKDRMAQTLKDLSELMSNCLSIYADNNGSGGGSGGDSDFAGIPIENRRRRLLGSRSETIPDPDAFGYPEWMSTRERILLATPSSEIQADVTVAKDGGGTVTTIKEAIKMAPEKSDKRFIIHIMAGRYQEADLKVGRKKTNLWFVGDGKGKTVITGRKSVGHDNITTFHTASFAATGAGFVAKDITFANEAGLENHQAVALRVGADHAAVYRCEIKGYQDTLYVHSQRQFYRECDIYGTVDFIFGNAVVVFQNCTMYARKPLDQQKVTITAQNRKEANQNTGMSIHACQVLPASDLKAANLSSQTYLGRPWKAYSRVVYMLSYIGDHVDPRGWLEWNATSPVDKLYYGEYKNYGPSSSTIQRVKWPGVHVNMSMQEANMFTVGQFIGSSWLTSIGVAFQDGLTG
ncbi:hypothetical protein Nepgr_020193 [Nepenthes gracilis]|uniref:Pectinesterase n=1 Tax=Nepenthes gracilis TaxID=150966 RepID=A0AAD3SWL5_NEPGR|nr:hypothetical protein Nepgr_020193 [Nepenthes gracilis]